MSDTSTDDVGADVPMSDEESQTLWNEITGNKEAPDESGDDDSIDDSEQQNTDDASDDTASDAESTDADDDSADDDGIDIWADANEAQRLEFQQLQKLNKELDHRVKSDSGRVKTLRQQVQQLTEQVEQFQSQQQKPAESQQETDLPVSWKKYQQDFPDDAAAISELLETANKSTTSKIAQLEQTIEQLQSSQGAGFYDILDAQRPDWRDTVQSESFTEWLVDQAEPVQLMQHSTKVRDAVKLLSYYDDHLATQKAKAEEIKKQRKQRLSETTSVEGKGGATPTADGDDTDAMWNAAIKAASKRLGKAA